MGAWTPLCRAHFDLEDRVAVKNFSHLLEYSVFADDCRRILDRISSEHPGPFRVEIVLEGRILHDSSHRHGLPLVLETGDRPEKATLVDCARDSRGDLHIPAPNTNGLSDGQSNDGCGHSSACKWWIGPNGPTCYCHDPFLYGFILPGGRCRLEVPKKVANVFPWLGRITRFLHLQRPSWLRRR